MDNGKIDPDKLTALLRGMTVRAAVLEGITGLAGEMQIEFGDLTK